MIDLKDFTRQEIKDISAAMGFEKYRGDQIFEGIYKGARDIEGIKGLPEKHKAALKAEYFISKLKVAARAVSKIDSTVKFLFELSDGEKIESVLIPDKERNTLCISSQVGCACACGFCATATLGFKRDLTCGEILNQFIYASSETGLKIDNLVFMGMGEPLLNWANVKKAISILNDEKGFHFSRARITVSTVGILPVMKEIADNDYKFKLAVSIITANDEVRNKLVPMNKKYPLVEIAKMCRYFSKQHEEPLMFEYPLFSGVNDSVEDAEALYQLMKGVKYKLNIIPYNNVKDKPFFRPERETALVFQEFFTTRNIMAFIRKEKGADIAGACGQLAAVYNPKA
jgi:23S rRNA (adenine2503-C2)-methyltransferase